MNKVIQDTQDTQDNRRDFLISRLRLCQRCLKEQYNRFYDINQNFPSENHKKQLHLLSHLIGNIDDTCHLVLRETHITQNLFFRVIRLINKLISTIENCHNYDYCESFVRVDKQYFNKNRECEMREVREVREVRDVREVRVKDIQR